MPTSLIHSSTLLTMSPYFSLHSEHHDMPRVRLLRHSSLCSSLLTLHIADWPRLRALPEKGNPAMGCITSLSSRVVCVSCDVCIFHQCHREIIGVSTGLKISKHGYSGKTRDTTGMNYTTHRTNTQGYLLDVSGVPCRCIFIPVFLDNPGDPAKTVRQSTYSGRIAHDIGAYQDDILARLFDFTGEEHFIHDRIDLGSGFGMIKFISSRASEPALTL